MEKYIVTTASTCDLDQTWLKAHQVPFISYTISIEGKEFEDDCSEEMKTFVYDEMMQDKHITTTCVSTFAYMQFFEKYLKEGYDILMLDMSSSLTSSHDNALLAARNLKEKYPDARIEIPETGSVTLVLGMLVKEVVAMKEAGKGLDEVLAWLNDNAKKYSGRFMVSDLKWLKRGGRLSNASAFVGTLLSVKPLIQIDKDGKLFAYAKVHGEKKACQKLIQESEEYFTPATKDHEIALVYAGKEEEGNTFLQAFQTNFPMYTNIRLYRLGPVIMSHIGPKFSAIVIYGKER